MTLIIVPSHHDCPENLYDALPTEYSKTDITKVEFTNRETTRYNSKGIIVPTKEALAKVLIDNSDTFSSYRYKSSFYIGPDGKKHMYGMNGMSSITLVNKDSLYSRCMNTLIDTLSNIPVVAILQAELFNAEHFDGLEIKCEHDSKISQDDIIRKFPLGILAYSKRIWPEFYSSHNGQFLLSFTHHPYKNNYPYYNAFTEDPIIGEMNNETSTQDITNKFNNLQELLINRINSKTK